MSNKVVSKRAALAAAHERNRRNLTVVLTGWLTMHCPRAKELLGQAILLRQPLRPEDAGQLSHTCIVDNCVRVEHAGSGGLICVLKVEPTATIGTLRQRVYKAWRENHPEQWGKDDSEKNLALTHGHAGKSLWDTSLSVEACGLDNGCTVTVEKRKYSALKSISNHGCVSVISLQGANLFAAAGKRFEFWDTQLGKGFNMNPGSCRKLTPPGNRRIVSASVTPSGWVIVGRALSKKTGIAQARVWTSRQQRRSMLLRDELHRKAISAVCVCGDKFAVTGSRDGKALCWDISSAQKTMATPLRELVGHKGSVLAACSSRSGLFCVTGCADGIARLFLVHVSQDSESDSASFAHQQFVGHAGAISALDINSGDNLLLTGAADGVARLFHILPIPTTSSETETAMETMHPIATLKADCGVVQAVRLTSERAITIANSGDSVFARIWSVSAGDLIRTVRLICFYGSLISAAIDEDGSHVFTGSTQDRKLRMWDLESGQQVAATPIG